MGNMIPETSGLANSMVMKKTNPNLMFNQSYYDQNNTAGVDMGYDYSGVKPQPVAAPAVATTKTTGSLVPSWLTSGTSGAGWTNEQYVADQMNKVDPNAGTPPKEQGWFDVPEGSQTSKFGSTMSGIGAGIQGLTGLGALYYENKKYGLQKQAAELEKDKYARAVKADKSDQANKALMAKNAGNGAAYIGY